MVISFRYTQIYKKSYNSTPSCPLDSVHTNQSFTKHQRFNIKKLRLIGRL